MTANVDEAIEAAAKAEFGPDATVEVHSQLVREWGAPELQRWFTLFVRPSRGERMMVVGRRRTKGELLKMLATNE